MTYLRAPDRIRTFSGLDRIRNLVPVCFLLVAAACSGGGYQGGNPQAPNVPPPPPPPEEVVPRLPPALSGTTCDAGIDRGDAKGGVWFAPVPDLGERRLLMAETGEFRLTVPDGWVQIFGSFHAVDGGLVSDDAISVWVAGLTWLETEFAGVDSHGEFDDGGNLVLTFAADDDPDNAVTSTYCARSAVYARGSSLATIAGQYANDRELLSIDGHGEVSYQEGACVGKGSIEVIDERYNMYRMDLEITSCDNAIYTKDKFSGLAYLGDSGPGHTSDLLDFSLTTASDPAIAFWDGTAKR